MKMKNLAGLAVALMALTLTGSLMAQSAAQEHKKTERRSEDIATLEQQSRDAYAAGDWVRFYVANIKLNKQRPYEPEYMANIVRACGRLDRKSAAYNYMLIMQKQGLQYDFNAFEDTLPIRNTEAYSYINDLLIRAGDPAGAAETFARVSVPARSIQALGWDSTRERLLAGTAQGALVSIGGDGSVEPLRVAGTDDGLGSINGLVVDAEHGRLWLATTASTGEASRSALVEMDLKSLDILHRYEPSSGTAGHDLGNLALSQDGYVYVIDRATNTVYQKTPDNEALFAFVTSSDLHNLRDIAVTPENSRIFVADRYKGVWVIDPVAEQTAMLTGEHEISLGRVEGLEYQSGELYLLQSGIAPDRLVRLQLDSSGAHANNIRPVASGLPEFSGPGALTLNGTSFWFVANHADEEAGEALVMTASTDTGRDSTSKELQKAQDKFLPKSPESETP